jgi:hypothetical protein
MMIILIFGGFYDVCIIESRVEARTIGPNLWDIHKMCFKITCLFSVMSAKEIVIFCRILLREKMLLVETFLVD